MSNADVIRIGVDASGFNSEMSYEVAAFKHAVAEASAYPFVRLLTTQMLFPYNDTVVPLLERRGPLEPAGGGLWTNRFHFDCAIEYHLLQAGRLVRMIVSVPANVEMEIDASDPAAQSIRFSPKWRTDILDSIVYEGNEVRFNEPVYLSRLVSREGSLTYHLANADETIRIELEATYTEQAAGEGFEHRIKLEPFTDLGAIAKAIGTDLVTVDGPCSPGPRRRPPPTRDGRYIYIHVRLVDANHPNFNDQIQHMVSLFEFYGFNPVIATQSILSDPSLLDIDVGNCWMGQTTADQDRLFSHRAGIPDYEVAVYFIRSTNPPLGGCAAFRDSRKPSCVVTASSSRWTAAHEVGHVLGLYHVDDNRRLMTGNGTGNIVDPPPDLVQSELLTIQGSNYSQAPHKSKASAT